MLSVEAAGYLVVFNLLICAVLGVLVGIVAAVLLRQRLTVVGILLDAILAPATALVVTYLLIENAVHRGAYPDDVTKFLFALSGGAIAIWHLCLQIRRSSPASRAILLAAIALILGGLAYLA